MNPASWQGLAGIYLERGEDDLALSQLLELVRLGEADPEIPAHIAGIYRRRADLRESRYWYVRALRVNPFSVKVHDGLGDTEMQLGNTKAALREYVMLTRIEPKKAGALRERPLSRRPRLVTKERHRISPGRRWRWIRTLRLGRWYRSSPFSLLGRYRQVGSRAGIEQGKFSGVGN